MMKLGEKLKHKMNSFLEDLAQENRKSFGNSRPDCCSLNRQTSPKEKRGNHA